MAAPMKCMTLCKRNCLAFTETRLFLGFQTNNKLYSTKHEDFEFEREVAKVQDVSGLKPWQKRRQRGQLPGKQRSFKRDDVQLFKTRSFGRRSFAEHGLKAGNNPGIMWPSKKELELMIREEKKWDPTFEDMMKNIQSRQTAKIEAEQLRDKKIEESMAKMPELIRKFKQKQESEKASITQKNTQAIDDLLEEFRDTYGYSVTKNSIQFKDFKLKKSEEFQTKKQADKKEMKRQNKEKFLETYSDLVKKSQKHE